MTKLTLAALFLFSAVAVSFGQKATPTPEVPKLYSARSPADCTEAPPSNNPRARRSMKIRGPQAGAGYTAYNGGKAIDVDEWFKYTCGLNKFVVESPEDKPIDGAENVTVTLTGYVLAVKYMRTGDGDVHVELGETADWDGDHMVVEMSPGADFCKARAVLWKIAEKDGCKTDECILKKPVKVTVKGYMLLGQVPQGTTDYCNAISTRGLKDEQHPGKVRGIWRLQPVLSLKLTK